MSLLSQQSRAKLHEAYPSIYGNLYDEGRMDERYNKLIDGYTRTYGPISGDIAIFSTSGRTELVGNHTDHNMGRVIAASINLDTIAAVQPSGDSLVTLVSEGFPAVTVDLNDLEKKNHEKETATSLVRGIARAFASEGIQLKGWKAYTSTTVLKGSGLSSSAAIEVLCATIFNHYCNNDAWDMIKLAQTGKYAENVYFEKPSGLMDQAACAYGGIIGIDFAHPEKPAITPVTFDFYKAGYVLAIVDTGGNHADLTADYASIPPEMISVAQKFGKKFMSGVSEQEFYAELPSLRRTLGNDRALLRAIHFFDENRRVDRMLTALKNHDMDTYLALTDEACHSAWEYLQNIYPPEAAPEQGLSMALALSRRILDGSGACRNHGGGFAGTILAYVPRDKYTHYKQEMERVFGENTVSALAIRERSSSRLV